MADLVAELFPPVVPLAVGLGPPGTYQHVNSPVDGTGVARWNLLQGSNAADRTLFADTGPLQTIDLMVVLRFSPGFPWFGVDECCMIQIQREANPQGNLRPGVSIRFNMPNGPPRPNTIELNGGMHGIMDYILPNLTPTDVFGDGAFHTLRVRETEDGTNHSYQAWIDGVEVTGPVNTVASNPNFGLLYGFRNGHHIINLSQSGHWVEYDSITATDGI